jgi:lipoteichoic acid synthase
MGFFNSTESGGNMSFNMKLFKRSPFLVFSILLLLKIYMTDMVIFHEFNMIMTFVTGMSSVWFVFGLIESLSSKRKLLWYIISDLVMTCIYFAAIMYYQYYGVIVTYHALKQANQVTQVKGSVFYLLHPYFLLIFIDIVVFFILYFSYRKIRLWGKAHAPRARRSAAIGAALSLVLCIIIVYPYRESLNEIKQAQEMGILNYEVHAILSDQNQSLIPIKQVTTTEIARLKGIQIPTYSMNNVPNYWKAAEGKNVIVIQLEAFQNFLLNLRVDGTEITPVLNQLMKESIYFPNVFQQVGQGNTADAEFVVNTSFYVPPHGAATDEYADKRLPGLPRLFKEKGYLSTTFHTNDVAFWNRKELYQALGYDQYFDKAFFGDEDIVKFGASDEVLYRKTAEEMAEINKGGKPFYAQVISMSGHHPFDLPEKKQRITLPDRYKGSFVNDYLISQNYADYALGLYIDELKAAHLWENSLFVIYGDHMGLPIYSLSAQDKTLLYEIYGREYSYAEMMNIPLLIAAPGTIKPAIMQQVGGQVDFMPTISNLAGISLVNHLHFGQDLLNEKHNLLPEHYYLPTGSFINENAIFVPGNGFKDGISYLLHSAESLNFKVYEDEFQRAQRLFAMSNSYVRHLPPHE